ncbi:Major facilitator superfamily domain, general substrate transporter [Ascosphaera apis ARSEF 7405]|uniref:Major facilitator superfamily domain, general substrate transporter n=1 Tax=Ascosphaera apis ARSEF 7405 TaxID=392613 RepID=A0A167Z831_9EURO|nr:Major facilitator superfamily domain, general substrate transporter [Ascosphaera apis ARSEF 7405]
MTNKFSSGHHEVPGTVHLVEAGDSGAAHEHASSPHRKDIILVPKPSNDPEDPLNWSQSRKYRCMVMVYVFVLGIGIGPTMVNSLLADITKDTGIPTGDLVQATGAFFLLLGWGALFWQPIALSVGRRSVYLISTLLTIPLLVWMGYSKGTSEWYGHRVLMGLVDAPIECLPQITVSDLFFAHERGTFMSAYVFILYGSNFVAPIIAGWFNDAFGWRWTFWFGSMITALSFVILFFFMEETMYFRHTIEGEEVDETVTSAQLEKGALDGDEKSTPTESSDSPTPPATATAAAVQERPISHKPWYAIADLRVFRLMDGRPRFKQAIQITYRPLIFIFQYPTTLWSGFMYGQALCWYTVLNGTASPVLSAPPYNWKSGLVGTIYVGPLLGSAFGTLISGILGDKFTIWMARRNKGIREPEQRLWLQLLAAPLIAAGLILWGVGAGRGIHWVGLAFGLLLMQLGCAMSSSISLSYSIDCFREISGETVAGVTVIRNSIGFGISYATTPWYTNMGLQNAFITAGMVAIGCCLTSLPMMYYGKACRRFSAKYYFKYLDMLNNRS